MNLIFEFGKHHDLNVWSQTCKSVQKTLSCCVPEFYVVEKSKTLSQNMIQFCSQGNLNVVKYLDFKGVKNHVETCEPLIEACKNGHLHIVQFLDSKNPNICKYKNEYSLKKTSPWIAACKNDHLHVLAFLIVKNPIPSIKDKKNAGLLSEYIKVCEIACENGNLEIVQYLSSQGLNVLHYLAFRKAVKQGHWNIIKYMTSLNTFKFIQFSPLDEISHFGNVEMYEYLISKGCKENLNLHLQSACSGGNLTLVKYLIAKGANIHQIHPRILVSACQSGNIQMVEFMIQHGFSTDQFVDEGFVYASKKDDYPMMEYLLSVGVKLNICGCASLYYACTDGNLKRVKYLVEKGVNIKQYQRFLISEIKPHHYMKEFNELMVNQNNVEMNNYLISKGLDEKSVRIYMSTKVEILNHLFDK